MEHWFEMGYIIQLTSQVYFIYLYIFYSTLIHCHTFLFAQAILFSSWVALNSFTFNETKVTSVSDLKRHQILKSM